MRVLNVRKEAFFNDNFNNALQNFLPSFSSMYHDEVKMEGKAFVPVNIKEEEANYLIEAIAPGFIKEDFKINLDKNILIISAEKKLADKTGAKTIRSEYNFSSFSRSFTLTNKVDADAISAEYLNGVLILNLPKKVEVKAPVKQISIN